MNESVFDSLFCLFTSGSSASCCTLLVLYIVCLGRELAVEQWVCAVLLVELNAIFNLFILLTEASP